MSAIPACPAPRPLRALLSDALAALLDPLEDAPRPAPAGARPPAGGYAAFESPTYLRRGIRIAGLEALDAPATPPSRAVAAPSRRGEPAAGGASGRS